MRACHRKLVRAVFACRTGACYQPQGLTVEPVGPAAVLALLALPLLAVAGERAAFVEQADPSRAPLPPPCPPAVCLSGRLSAAPACSARVAAAAGSAKTCVSQASNIADVVREQNAKNKVVVYSKSYCPYCAQVGPPVQWPACVSRGPFAANLLGVLKAHLPSFAGMCLGTSGLSYLGS